MAGGAWVVLQFLEFDREQKLLNAQATRLEAQEVGIRIARDEATRMSFHQESEVKDLGPSSDGDNVFLVSNTLTISNVSSKRHEVSMVTFEALLAEVPSLEHSEAVLVPPFDAPSRAVALAWRPLLAIAHHYTSRWQEGTTAKLELSGTVPLVKGGGGTSELDPDESSVGSLDILVRCKPNSLIGFQTKIFIDGGLTPADRWRFLNRFVVAADPPDALAEKEN